MITKASIFMIFCIGCQANELDNLRVVVEKGMKIDEIKAELGKLDIELRLSPRDEVSPKNFENYSCALSKTTILNLLVNFDTNKIETLMITEIQVSGTKAERREFHFLIRDISITSKMFYLSVERNN